MVRVLLLNQIPEVNNKYTFSLARGLRKQDVDVTVYGIEDDDYSPYTDVPYENRFFSYSKEKGYIKKIRSYYKSWKRIVSYCKRKKIQIVHVQWYIFSPMDYFFHNQLRKKGIKVITTIHDLLPFNKKFYDFYFHKLIYCKADMVINQARMNKDELVKKFKVNEKRIAYVPHGHYMEYAEMATKQESRKKLSIPEEKKVILFFGQIKKVKGVDILIRAMREVVNQHEDVLCVIAGKVWKDDFGNYQRLIEALKLQDYIRTDIRFINDNEIKYYFNAADIVALPYLQIYQSGVVLLAYAYEKPVVATKQGEFLTVVKNGETGLLVSAGDSTQLAEAINWYLDNPLKAEKFGKDGKKDIEERLSWEAIACRVKNIYTGCIEE